MHAASYCFGLLGIALYPGSFPRVVRGNEPGYEAIGSQAVLMSYATFLGKFMLALCHNLKAANYAQNYAGIIFASLPRT